MNLCLKYSNHVIPVIVSIRVIKLSPHSGTFRSSTSAMFLYCDSQAVGEDIIASNFSIASVVGKTRKQRKI